MNRLIKAVVISTMIVGLAACTKPAPAPQPKPVMVMMPSAKAKPVAAKKDSMKECHKVKKQVRHVDRAAPDAQAKISALEAKLDAMNCGGK
jgi:hypothetical protein